MASPYRPLAFANEFIVMAQPSGVEHMKLQKLVYYTYGWWIAYHPSSIISEPPQVWKFGPVFLSLYHALKNHGRTPITTVQSDYPFQPSPRVDSDDADARQLVQWVWQKYGSYSSFELSDMTHAPGTPWQRIAERHNWVIQPNTPIPDDMLRDSFRALAKEMGLPA